MLIFAPITAEHARVAGLFGPNIFVRGLLTSSELLDRFREEIDILFVPISFDAADRANVEVNFPSKLTDYTAAGLPMVLRSQKRTSRKPPSKALYIGCDPN